MRTVMSRPARVLCDDVAADGDSYRPMLRGAHNGHALTGANDELHPTHVDASRLRGTVRKREDEPNPRIPMLCRAGPRAQRRRSPEPARGDWYSTSVCRRAGPSAR